MRGADDLTRPRPQIRTSRHQLKEYSIHVSAQDLHPAIARGSAEIRDGSRARHLTTFTTFGVSTHGVWTERSDSANRLVALIGYPPGADPEQLTRQVMTSPQFAADMDGFDPNEIVDVQSALLDPTSFSPIH